MILRALFKNVAGFTLVEIIAVSAVLLVIAGVLLAIIDPIEQINKATDASTRTTAEQFQHAAIRYGVAYQQFPWQQSSACVIAPTGTPTPTPTNTPTPTLTPTPTNTPTPTPTPLPTNTPTPTPTPTPYSAPACSRTQYCWNLGSATCPPGCTCNGCYTSISGNGVLCSSCTVQTIPAGSQACYMTCPYPTPTPTPTLTPTPLPTLPPGTMYLSSSLQNGLLSFWSFPENCFTAGCVRDSMGSNSLTPVSSPAQVAGKFTGTYARNFANPSSQYLFGTDSSPLFPSGSTPRTIAAWVNIQNNNYYVPIFSYGTAVGTMFNFWVYPPGAYWVVSDGNSPARAVVITGSWNTLNWHHIAVTYDGSTISFYLDGVFKGSQTGITLSTGSTVSTFSIGRATNDNWAGTGYMNGIIDEVGIWNRALTQTDITNLYNSVAPSGLAQGYVAGSSTFEPPGNQIAQIIPTPTPTPASYSTLPASLTLAGLKPCVDQMIAQGEIKSNFDTISQSTLNSIYVFSPDPNNSSNPKSILTCYKPLSKAARSDPLYKFDQTGSPTCNPSSNSCYICITE